MKRLLLIAAFVVTLPLGASESWHSSPAAPENLRAWWVEPDFIYLKWEAVHAEEESGTYRLYRNDELVATTFKTYFLDMEYDRDVWNDYFVTAVDASGKESPPSATLNSPANPSP